jgi:putative aldouronate transport system permease protein
MKKEAIQSSPAMSAASLGIMLVISLACLIPFIIIISASFTDNAAIIQNGYSILPSVFSSYAYTYLFRNPTDILQAYSVTIFITLVGTSLGLILITMAGYVLNRNDFRYRNHIAFFIYFTTLFSAGMIPTYMLVVMDLNLKDSLWAVILMPLLTPFNVLLMRNFMKSIPHEMIEAAKIDSAGDWKIFTRIVLPLSGPGIATIGLFLALQYWNDWYQSMLYLSDADKFPLQLYLYNILTAQQNLANSGEIVTTTNTMPTESIKMAMAVVATGPIILAYPFVQKYFVKGIMIGAVKG